MRGCIFKSAMRLRIGGVVPVVSAVAAAAARLRATAARRQTGSPPARASTAPARGAATPTWHATSRRAWSWRRGTAHHRGQQLREVDTPRPCARRPRRAVRIHAALVSRRSFGSWGRCALETRRVSRQSLSSQRRKSGSSHLQHGEQILRRERARRVAAHRAPAGCSGVLLLQQVMDGQQRSLLAQVL